MLRYEELTAAEAEARAAATLASLPAKVERLRRDIAATGTDPAFLDAGRAGLVPLWRWVVAWHDAGGSTRAAELPDWYEPDPPAVAGQRLSPATLQLVDLLGAHLAQVFMAAVPDLRWVVVPARGKGRIEDVHVHQPVLRGSIIDVNPRHLAMGKAIRLTLWDEDRHPTALADTVTSCIEAPGIP